MAFDVTVGNKLRTETRVSPPLSTTVQVYEQEVGIPEFRREVYRSNTPRRIKPKGVELLFDGQHYHRYTKHQANGLLTYEFPGYYARVPVAYWIGSGSSGDQTVHPTSLDQRLLAKVKDEKVNLAMALAEYRQTAALFADTAARVAGAWRAFRRGDVVGGVTRFRGSNRRWLSSNWLAFQYGVRPLYLDVKNSLEVLDSAIKTKPIVFKNRVRSVATFGVSSDVTIFGNRKGSSTVRQKSIKSLTSYHTVDNSLITTATSLGFTNPLALAWELVPYSFVVDWFVNVGDWLGSIDALYGVNRFCYYSYYRFEEIQNSVGPGGGSSYNELSVTRSGAIHQVPNFPLQWQPSLSWQRIASGLSLLRQSRSI